ncbi:MAG TPA: TlpA disulfide reductase family protein [Pyrinomonadaceae bacterium]|nr:TlpA disulfide reductase family protein [Pyrinomonadaceae bacterium]
MNNIRITVLIILSIIASFLIATLRVYEFGSLLLSSSIGFTLYFLLTISFLKIPQFKLSALKIILAIVTGLFLIQIPARIYDFSGTLSTLPDFLLHFLGIICGFFYWSLKKPFNILAVFLSVSIVAFVSFKGYGLWSHKLNYGTFTGKVLYDLPVKFAAFDDNKNLILDDDFHNKIVLLDFWNTRCGICFEKFPQLQNVYEKYRDDKSIVIFAVNKPIEEDKPNQAFDMIREQQFSFPVVITKDEDLAEKWGVKGYPTTFVINQTGQIVYKGDIEGAIEMVDELKLNSR